MLVNEAGEPPKEENAKALVKIDLGCGAKKYRGPDAAKPVDDWIGLDRIAFDGVDHVVDLGKDRWPFDDGSVDEAYSSHFLEHLTKDERVHFANELYRVLVMGGACTIVVPHWSSCRAYGDPTHEWPPMSEFWFMYLSRKWRLDDGNAPHTDVKHNPKGFNCDFDAVGGYGMNPILVTRGMDFQQFAMTHYKEAIFDIHSSLKKK